MMISSSSCVSIRTCRVKRPHSRNPNLEELRGSIRRAHSISSLGWMGLLISLVSFVGVAQTPDLPFTVSNPKHKKWPVDEAQRIYFAACERVAKANRPEKPPLHP